MLNATASVSAVSYIQPDAMGLEKTYDTTMGREKTASALSFIMLKSPTGSGQLSFVA